MQIPYKPTKSAGGDPRRPRRLRRCTNQDRLRGRNYTSNRGCHATFNGSVRLDTSGTRPFMETVRDAYSRCGHAYLTVACVLPGPLAGFLRWRLQSLEGPMATSIAGGASISTHCNPRCQEHQVFPRLATTESQARWRDGNNFHGGATNRNLSRED